MSGSANERPDCSHQPPTAASDSTEAGAEDVADTANQADNATSDRTRRAPNGLDDCSADRDKALTYPPNYSEREAGSAHEGANQPQPHDSYSSTGTRGQPLERGADTRGEGDDHAGHPAERVTQAPQHRANRA
jgi:hypothetical protein